MPDFRSLYDSEWLRVWDLKGREVTTKVLKVAGGVVTGEGGKKSKKAVLRLEGFDKPFAICKTDGKTMAALYGNDYEGWSNKLITLFPTTTTFAGATVECIRIKPQRPSSSSARPTVPASDREPGSDDDR